MKNVFLFCLYLSLLSCNKGGAIKEPVEDFYNTLTKEEVLGFPDADEMAPIASFISKNLHVALESKQRKSIEVDDIFLFASSRSIPDSFQIMGFINDTKHANVDVHFWAWNDKDTVEWNDEVRLVQNSGKWQIDDILYKHKSNFRSLSEIIEYY